MEVPVAPVIVVAQRFLDVHAPGVLRHLPGLTKPIIYKRLYTGARSDRARRGVVWAPLLQLALHTRGWVL